MMNAELNPEHRPPAVAVEALVAEYGLIRVVLALAGLMARSRAAPRRHEADLPDRVRRDIGLAPLPESRKYWDL